MPPRKTKTVIVKKKRKYTRRAQKRLTVGPSRVMVSFMPIKKSVNLKWAYVIKMDASAIVPAQQICRLNSLYAPDYNGATPRQPLQFDQWSALYQSYYVKSCAYKVSFVNPGSSASTGTSVLSVQASNSVTPISSLLTLIESTNSNWKYIPIGQNSKSTTSLNGIWNVAKENNLKDIEDNDAYQAIITKNPDSVDYLHIQNLTYDPAGVINPDAVWVTIELMYYAVFFNPVSPSAS